MIGKSVDWPAIGGAYLAGPGSVLIIASADGISGAKLWKSFMQLGWSRDPSGAKRTVVNAHLAGGTQGSSQDGEQIASAASFDTKTWSAASPCTDPASNS